MDEYRHDKEEHWMAVSDLMSVLMLVFLLIAIIKIKNVSQEKPIELNNYNKIKQEVSDFLKKEDELYKALQKEFANDFKKWNAELVRENLKISFKDETIMFEKSKSVLTNRFKEILQDFFPRYIRVLKEKQEIISEVRLEGHTSSEWQGSHYKEAYFNNMKLSQERTTAVLEYSMKLPKIDWDWTKSYITANGLSSSKLITRNVLNKDIEDSVRSRRVEFRLLTKTKQLINKVRTISNGE